MSTSSEPEVIPDQTLSVEDVVRPKVIMLYGQGKIGKTVAATTFPKPIVCLDMDEGLDSIMWAIKKGICPHTVSDIRRAIPGDELDEAGKLKKATGYWQALGKINAWFEEPDTWETLVVDPLTTLNMFAMTAGMEVSGRYPSSEKPYSESGKWTKQAGVLLTGIQDYRPAQSFVWQFVEGLKRAAKKHRKWVVIICHIHEITRPSAKIGEEPTVIGHEPELWGQQRKTIIKGLDEVYYVRGRGAKDKRQVIVQTAGTDSVVAGSRFGCLDTEMDITGKPLFPEIKRKVEEFYGVPLE